MRVTSRAVLYLALALLVSLAALVGAASKAQQSKGGKKEKKGDPNDNKDNTPFFLQDPHDSMCLGPAGFTVCDERALWILTRRSNRKTYSLVSLLNPTTTGMCLERKSTAMGILSSDRVSMGACNSAGSKSWEFEFIDNKHVKLSTNKHCLMRGKKSYKNSVSVQHCNRKEFTPLVYHPTAVHEAGFYLKAADGACFDGSTFRSCEGSQTLLWGVGIKYIWNKAHRYFFNFAPQERGLCLVASGKSVAKGECSKSGALQWGLKDGQLTAAGGRMCVARLANNDAVLAKCSEASEYITMEVPTTYSAEDLQEMLQNQDKLSPEEKQKLAQLVKQYELSR